MTDGLADRVVVITGGSRGFGRALANEFAGRRARVALTARSREGLDAVAAEAGAHGVAVRGYEADVTEPAAMAAALAAISDELGPPDVLINNAGVSTARMENFAETDLDDWWQTVDVNLRGTAIVTRLVLPGMLERNRGRVISITSRAAVHQWPLASSYVVSKAGVVKLMENTAAELRGTGVTAFSFDPGILRAGLTDAVFEWEAEPGSNEALVKEWFVGQIAAGRSFDPAESARVVADIASGAVDALTGRHLSMYDDLDDIFGNPAEIAATNRYYLRRT